MPSRVRSAILWTGLLAALWSLIGCSASKDPETEGAGSNVLIRRPYLTVSECEGEAEERRLVGFDRSQ